MRKSPSLFGGLGWTRTNDVSNVTDLQSAAVAAMHTDPYGVAGWDWTSEAQIFSLALYQLSYGSIFKLVEIDQFDFCI